MSLRSRFRRARISALPLVLLAFQGSIDTSATAQEPKIIERLRQEPTTLFDMGMKRLRRAALDAAIRMSVPPDWPARSSVRYQPDTATIEVRFEFQSRTAPNDAKACAGARTRAIRETFAIGRTAYLQKLSYGERVRRRLGLIFAHEPVGSTKEIIAIGQRLAEITVFNVVLVNSNGATETRCGGALANVDRRQ